VIRYRIVPDRSTVTIDARSNVHPIHSRCEGLEGFLDVDWTDADQRIPRVVAAALSLPVSRLSSGNKLEDRELRRRIDAGRHPTISGVLANMAERDATGRYRVGGDITFRGVTRRHEDDMTVTALDDATLQLEGESRFDIREFGMEPPRILMLRVEPHVVVRVSIIARREA